jgi:Na+/melibiose symporter-like transporter
MQSKLSSKDINKYGSYLMFSSLAAMVQMMYVTIFMTQFLQIPAAIAASTLLVARVIDFFIGVICGGIIEKAHLPWGKYRSWLLIFRFVIVGGIALTFFDTTAFPVAVRVVVSFIGYLALNGGMSFTTNAYYALGPALAGDNMEDRVKMSTRGAQFMCVAMLIVCALTLPLVNVLTPFVGSCFAYMIVAVVFAIPYIFSCGSLAKMSKEVDPDVRVDTGAAMPTVTLKDMVSAVVQNDQLLVVFMAYLIYYIGMYVVSGLGAYFWMYIIGNYNMLTVASTITMITGTVASLIVPKFTSKLGKKNALALGLLIYGVMYLFIYLFGRATVPFIVFSAIGGAAIYLFSTVGVNYFVDCGEYHLYKTGKDTRVIAVSMYSVPMKIGMALGGAIATYGLAFIGLDQVTATGVADAAFQNSFMVLLGIVPFVLGVLAAAVVKFGYKLTDDKASEYASENMKRMQEAMAAAAATENK